MKACTMPAVHTFSDLAAIVLESGVLYCTILLQKNFGYDRGQESGAQYNALVRRTTT